MELIITAKQLGKKHPVIEKKVIEIRDIGPEPSLRDLISAVVTYEVESYRSRATEKNFSQLFSETELNGQAASGKIGFGIIYSEAVPDPEKAIQTATQAFEDGMFAVFTDEQQISSLSEIVNLKENTVISFIRLTFLAGSYW